MNIGLDFNNTITAYPNECKKLAQTVLDGGGCVYIISACLDKNQHQTKERIKQSGIPFTLDFIVPYSDYTDVPDEKLRIIRRLDLDFYLDDNLETIKLCQKEGILAGFVVGTSRFGIM